MAVVGVCFEGSLDNGGRTINIVFQRAQSDKVRQKNIIGKNSVIFKKKVDIHDVDCSVTG